MRFISELIWTERAREKVANHGLTTADVAEIIDTAYAEAESRTSGLPIRWGYSIDGEHCAVVFRWESRTAVSIVTAYPCPEPE